LPAWEGIEEVAERLEAVGTLDHAVRNLEARAINWLEQEMGPPSERGYCTSWGWS
jgi:hypothetical protein